MISRTGRSSADGDTSGAVARRSPGEAIFAGVILGIGVMGFVAGAGIQTPPSASDIGPRAFPFLVSALLVVVGVSLLVRLRLRYVGVPDDSEDVDPSVKTDWLTVAKVVGFTIVHIALIVPLGWPVAAAVLFFGTAWSLGAKPWWRNAVISVLLSLALQFVFAGLLGVSLPTGFLLEGIGILHG